MSFILDALRKSEARRRMGEGPDLSRAPQGGRTGKMRRAGRWAGAGVLVVVALAFAGTAWIGRDLISGQLAQWAGSAPPDLAIPSDRPLLAERIAAPPAPLERGLAGAPDRPERVSPRREQPPAVDPGHRDRRLPDDDERIDRALPRERIVTDPAEIESELARRMAEEQAHGAEETGESAEPASRLQRRRQAPMDPARVAEIERQVAEAEARRREIERESERAAELEAEEAARLAGLIATPVEPERQQEIRPETLPEAGEPWRSSTTAREYVRAWELPLSIRRSLPDLRLSIHVYSTDEAQRFVLVNGERFVVGDQLGDGARLVDIRREGAVVDFRDYRFLLEP
ncbi:MAG: hypothetical protein EA370_08085 [Wenzhouxiangella sp.]|nr:MAG: hypothetical protein EA370_08085 [Wenzhouxiangella sp.]